MSVFRPLVWVGLIGLALGSAARADLIQTFTFDELPPDTTANGLVFKGVQFGFSGPNPGDAFYNSSTFQATPDVAQLLQGSVLEGDSAGLLTLGFLTPVNQIRFAGLLSSVDTLIPGFTVELFGLNGASLFTLGVTTAVLTPTGFSEALFDFSSAPNGPLISRAVVNFNDDAGRFAIDNLRINIVPEPAGLTLAALGGVVLAANALRRRTRQAA